MLYTNILRQNFELEQTKFPILLFTYNVSLNMSEERFLICTKPLIYHLCRKKIFCAINKQIDFFYKYVRKCLCKETWLLIVACVQLPSNWNEKKKKNWYKNYLPSLSWIVLLVLFYHVLSGHDRLLLSTSSKVLFFEVTYEPLPSIFLPLFFCHPFTHICQIDYPLFSFASLVFGLSFFFFLPHPSSVAHRNLPGLLRFHGR